MNPKILIYCQPPESAARYRELILERYPEAVIATASSVGEAQPHLTDTEILYGWKFPHEMLGDMPRLRWLQKMSAGVEDVLLTNSVPDGVIVTKADGTILAPRMAEYVLAAIYNHTLCNYRAFEQQRTREWQPYEVGLASGRTMGVAGLGDIGTSIARFGRAVGLRVLGWRRSSRPCDDVDALYCGDDQLKEFVSLLDYLVLVLPLTPTTRHVISESVLQATKPDLLIVNVGRGGVIDDTALIPALQDGRVAAAALDVFGEEPLPKDHPYWGMPNVRITPHVSGPVVPDEVVGVFLDNLDRYSNGKQLRHVVDPVRGY